MQNINNYDKFPFNILKPDTIEIDGKEYTRYRARFNSLHDLYNYLSANPQLNESVFYKLASLTNDSDFAGKPYKEALEDLNKPPRSEFFDFLELTKKLDEDALGYVKEYITVKSPGGGCIDIPSYVTGSPFCYKTTKSIYTPKFVKINISLSYFGSTTKKQVMNRALIIVSLINAFEQAGYIVDVNTFEISYLGNEISDIDVNIKNSDESFNKASLYKSICYVEFLRRLMFRVLETLDVKGSWCGGYGFPVSEKMARIIRRMDENDIFFDQPREMNITGNDIVRDFENVVEQLNIEDKIDVEYVKNEFNKSAKILRKTIV